MANRAMKWCAALAALAALMVAGLWTAPARAETDGMLRVKLTRLGAPSAVVLDADCALATTAEGLAEIPAGGILTVTASEGSLFLQCRGEPVEAGPVVRLIRAEQGAKGIRFTAPSLSNRFCGDVTLSASGDVVSAVLNIFVEDYLCGVVCYEMAPSSPDEALRAQAVAARSFALSQKTDGGEYDLTDNAGGYSFKGLSDSQDYARAVQAVNDTRGQVLWYDDALACGYCTESNGGQMESALNAFGSMAGCTVVADDAYDLESAGVKKTALLRKDGQALAEPLETLLVETAAPALAQLAGDAVTDVRVTAIKAVLPGEARFPEPSRLYAALTLEIQAEGANAKGNATAAQVSVTVPTYGGLEDWYDLGINDEDNETVWVEDQGDCFAVTFRRSGHGVGLSQRGALQMASRYGMSCQDILAYYFPGARLETLMLSAGVAQVTPEPTQPVPVAIAQARLQGKTELLAGPSEGASVTAILAAGAAVDIYSVEGGWAAVGSSGKQGFVLLNTLSGFALTGDDVQRLDPSETAALAQDQSLMELPASAARSLGKLAAGDEVSVLARTTQWAQVTAPTGETGFVPAAVLIAPTATPEATEVPLADLPEGMVPLTEEAYARATEALSLYRDVNDTESVAMLERGTYVKLLAESDQWAFVETSAGTRGYVQRTGLKGVAAPATKAPEATSGASGSGMTQDGGRFKKATGKRRAAYANADGVLVYQSNSEDSNVLASLSRGQKLLLGAYNARWAYVNTGSCKGFVLLSGLTGKRPKPLAPTPTPAPTAGILDDFTPEEAEPTAGPLDDFVLEETTPAPGPLDDFEPEDDGTEAAPEDAPEAEAPGQTASGGPSGGPVKRVKGRRVVSVKASMAVLYRSWDTGSEALAWLNRGDKVQLLAYNSDWAYVYTGRQKGYLSMAALTGDGGASASNLAFDAVTIIDLKLYPDTSMSGMALATVPGGSEVRVLGTQGHTVYVEYNNQKGYLPAGYIRKK